MDLAFQPREDDLVLATHGRSFYVLDDVSPLRSLDAAVLAEPLHLFPPHDAQQYRVAQSGSTRFAGDGAFRGTNEPYGALITFSLAGDDLPLPDPKAEKARRETELEALREEGAARLLAPTLPAAETAETAGEASGKPEEGKVEGAEAGEPRRGDKAEKEEPPKATIEIRTADGDLIRSFESEVHRGVNRAVWDLAHDAPAEPDRGDLPSWGEPSGPEAVPGDYTVTVRFGDAEASAPLHVLADPRFDVPAADRRARLDAQLAAGRLQETLTTAIERLRRTRQDVETVLARHAAERAEAARLAGDRTPEGRRGGRARPPGRGAADGDRRRARGAVDRPRQRGHPGRRRRHGTTSTAPPGCSAPTGTPPPPRSGAISTSPAPR